MVDPSIAAGIEHALTTLGTPEQAVGEQRYLKSRLDPRLAAVELLRAVAGGLEPTDIDLVEQLIRDSLTWALVDPLAVHVAGGLVDRHADLVDVLDRWSSDADFWVRRSAMLGLLVPLRRGDGDFARFAAYADRMLDDREFFIRKASCSGVTIREAVKHLSDDQRAAVLAARNPPPAGP